MSRFEWILTGILSILLIAVLALGVTLWLRPGIGVPPPLPTVHASLAPTPTLPRRTTMLAFNSARTAAVAWQPDARLVQASATWAPGASREEMFRGMASWDFTFLSSAASAIAIISVIEDEARLIAERPVAREPALEDVSGWRVDSPDAVARMMQEGGGAFLRDAGATTMTASLRTATERGQIEWFVSLISKYRGDSFSARIDATNGEVMAIGRDP